MELHNVVLLSPDPITLLDSLQQYYRAPRPGLHEQLPIASPGSTPETTAVLKLFTIEALLYKEGTLDYQKIDDLFKLLAGLAVKKPADNVSTLIRLKYLDLLTDYQLVLSGDVTDFKLIELVSKKINNLTGQDSSELLVHDIQDKVLVYYLLSGSDFRKKNIQQYLSDENIFLRKHTPAIEEFISLRQQDVLIPLGAYTELVSYLNNQSRGFRAVFNRHSDQFLVNFLETNLEKLPRYYRSIKISNIEFLLECDLVNYEDLIYRMIITKKFAAGTKIDQVQDMVDFGDETEKYDAFNTHIKKVCDVVESLAPAY